MHMGLWGAFHIQETARVLKDSYEIEEILINLVSLMHTTERMEALTVTS